MPRLLPAAICAASLVATSGCYRLSYGITDDDNPEAVYLTSTESGGVATHFQETVTVVTSLRGLISWNSADPREVLAKYYNTGKVQNLTIKQEQGFMEGALSLLLGGGSMLFDLRHVTFEGDVVRRFGS